MPLLESPEDRAVPAVFVVVDPGDAGVGTLRQAMLDAAANAERDLITFNGDLAGFTISLLTNSETTDFGPTALTIGADEVTIDAGGPPASPSAGTRSGGSSASVAEAACR
ncbi:hypothetical protein [Paludisphaera soli]|uniref:hypothetical protein n=1 Tax=Paludisphaera soli TaxID=2712865 RepID=UPI0013EA0674|nr:hypothetical protein [Paludisphaera soli]